MTTTADTFFIGWDVGAWNCSKKRASSDAIVIVDSSLEKVGTRSRENLRQSIATCATSEQWINELFALCGKEPPAPNTQITLAIDAPLGFSVEFVALVSERQIAEPSDIFGLNHYLFRRTERHLFEKDRAPLENLEPLSAINHMIGSQATKAMHALAKFAPHVESCGVWTDRRALRVIETYPSACRDTATIMNVLGMVKPLSATDENDAWVCALVANIFATAPEKLEPPMPEVAESEGWIWAPRI